MKSKNIELVKDGPTNLNFGQAYSTDMHMG